MKQNKLKKGFTLLEVMIALAVLSISMLGIYSLQNMSLKTLISAKEKMFVIIIVELYQIIYIIIFIYIFCGDKYA